MSKRELIEAFQAGDMGAVEFFETALLETDMSLEAIHSVLAEVENDL